MRKPLYWILAIVVVLGISVFAAAGILFFGWATPAVQASASQQATVVPNVQTAASRDTGLLVGAVVAGSPAEKAGLVRGDIILEVNNTAINQADRAAEKGLFQNLKSGDTVTLKVLHGDDTRTLKVTLGDQNGSPYIGIVPAFTPHGGKFGFMGKGPNGLTFPGKDVTGAWVIEVTSGGPADKAGLKAGDVIVKVNDAAINAGNDLAKALQALKPGDSVKVSAQRSGQANPVDLQVTLGSNPKNASQAFLGIRYHMLPLPARPDFIPPNGQNNPQQPFHNFQNGGNPVLGVVSVSAGSPAEKAGLKAGDLITQVNGKAVTNAQDFANLVKAGKSGDSLTLTVVRNKDLANPLTVTATLAANPDNSGSGYLGVTLGGGFRGGPRDMPKAKPTQQAGGNT